MAPVALSVIVAPLHIAVLEINASDGVLLTVTVLVFAPVQPLMPPVTTYTVVTVGETTKLVALLLVFQV